MVSVGIYERLRKREVKEMEGRVSVMEASRVREIVRVIFKGGKSKIEFERVRSH
jgi:hypothetical protein